MAQAYLKRFAALVTAFAHRLKNDIFYRTGWNVVLLQIGFVIVLLVLVLASLNYLYQEVIEGLIGAIANSIATGTTPTLDSVSIAANLEYEKQKSMLFTVTAVLMAAATFGYLITRMALTPTRNALESQKQFVGNIAHELRTPLSIIKTNTEVALFNTKLDDDTRETLVSNVEELDRISDIINNLLSMNRLLRPEKMEFKDVDLGPVIERVTQSLADLAEHKKITLRTELSDYCIVYGNPSALEQIIMNVTKNAFNYSPDGGKVSISVMPTYRGEVAIRIEDTGMGIKEEDLEHIFEPFYRGDASRNRKSGGGSGLGLAIVSELVKIHKGKIEIRSVPAAGTTVIITLPCGRKEEAPEMPKAGFAEVAMDFSDKKN